MPLLGSDDPLNDDVFSILDEVTLKAFTAKPTAIGPFGASVLNWTVSAPSAVHITLNGQNVPKSSTRIVHPTHTSIYRLSAYAGQASRFLGSVEVSVDRSSCETYDIANPQSAILAPVRQSINNDSTLYFSSDPGIAVSFSPGRIHLSLSLKSAVKHFPDPDVDIDASFGLVVHNGTLEPTAEDINVDIRFPFYTWFVPGAPLGLSIAIDAGKTSAHKRMHEAIASITDLLNFYATPPEGKRLSTVRIDDGNNGAGIVEFTACTYELLLKYADLSAVKILK